MYKRVVGLLVSCLLAAPALAHAQEAARGEIQLLESTDAECERPAVLQSFRGLGRSLCVVGQATHPAGVARVTLNGREAVLRAEAAGRQTFVGYIAMSAAAPEIRIAVESSVGESVVFEYWLSGLETGAPTLTLQDPMAAPKVTAAAPPAAAPAPDPAPGMLVVLEPTEWMGDGMRSVSVAPGDSLRVHGRVFHPSGVIRMMVNGRDVPLQAHPSGQMVFLSHVRAEDIDAGVEIIAYPAAGEPLRKFFGQDPALAPAITAAPTGANHYVEILEPTGWSGTGDRSVMAPVKRSVRVVGEAMHSGGGVRAVMIDNARASIQRQPNGAVRFVGYVPVDTVQKSIEVRVEGQTGQPIRQRLSVVPDPATRAVTGDAPAVATTGFRGQRWAVVVGVSRYEDEGIRALQYADRDAKAFYDFLRSPRAGDGGFKQENIRLLLNEEATYQALRTALRTFLRNSTEDDQVIVYFAGHGAPDPGRPEDMYLLAYDTRRNDISGTGFPMTDVKDAMQRVLARDILVITDACHSGAIGGDLAMRDLESNMINNVFLTQLNASTGGMVAFTASMANQTSAEGEQWGGGHGIFTYYLLEALNGAADEDGDQIVSLIEMMEWTKDRVRRETMNAQIPNISTTSYDQLWPMALVLDAAQLAAMPQRQDPRPAPTAGTGARSNQVPAAAPVRPAIPADVLKTARERVQLFPNSADYWSELGQVLREAGENEESIRAYQEAARLDPSNAVRRYDLGVRLRDAGSPDAAVASFEEAVRLAPRIAEYRNALGNVVLQNGDARRAADELQRAVRLDARVGRYHRDLAQALARQGNTRAAVAAFEEALTLEPSVASYHHEYARVLRTAGRGSDAINALATASRLDAGNADYHREAGSALQEAGRTREAITAYRRAAELQPTEARLRHELGRLFRVSGMQYETIEALREAVQLAPDSSTYRFDLGEALRSSAKPEDALPEFVAAIELAPENAAFHHGYGLALHRARQPKEAMDELREAVRLQPGNAQFHFDLTKILREAGLLDEAIVQIQKAIQLDKRNAVFKTELDQIKRQQKLLARQKR
jgi:tetratricopeptide (TPR) repeat protein